MCSSGLNEKIVALSLVAPIKLIDKWAFSAPENYRLSHKTYFQVKIMCDYLGSLQSNPSKTKYKHQVFFLLMPQVQTYLMISWCTKWIIFFSLYPRLTTFCASRPVTYAQARSGEYLVGLSNYQTNQTFINFRGHSNHNFSSVSILT